MQFQGFAERDFAVFEVEGLEERMAALKQALRPKLEQIGDDLMPFLSELVGMPMYAHVAKHARRKTNPPADSWVAWSHNPRGYKMFPHFQVGAWKTHAFIQWGIIYESPHKAHFGEKIRTEASDLLRSIPQSYRWYPDHTVNQGILTSELTEAELNRLADRLIHQKNGELMVGIEVKRDEAVRLSGESFLALAEQTFRNLAILHKAALSFTQLVSN